MSLGHNILIEKFELQQETKDLATKLVRLASQKTAPGSGRELKEWRNGLPAVCSLLASERLNNGDFNSKSAQAASCLKPKDFQRVYSLVKMAIEEAEGSSVVTYPQIHKKYRSQGIAKYVDPYIKEVEIALQPLAIGYEMESTMFRGVCYFWIFSIFAPTVMPSTERFAHEQELPIKKFSKLLTLLNEHATDLRLKIVLAFKGKRAAAKEAAESSLASPSATPSTSQRSPRKPAPKRELPNNDSPKKLVQTAPPTTEETEQDSPLRRSSRTVSPTKKVTDSVFRPWVKPPTRELPSKDSPKKRPAESIDDGGMTQDDATPPSTPTKKRKIISPSKPQPSSSSSAHLSLSESTSAFHLALALPTKNTNTDFYPIAAPLPSSPLKRTPFTFRYLTDAESSSDESEGVPLPRRRFRPVYVDSEQWDARDPRVAKIWRKAKMAQTSNTQRASSNRE